VHSLKSSTRVSINFLHLNVLTNGNGKAIHLWCSQDAFALKLIAQQLESRLSLSPACTHVKGHDGLKQCVVGVAKQLSDDRFVCKTDVKHYYQPILLKQLYDQVSNKTLRRYLYQVICRTVEYGGTYRDIRKGIARGCPISPLLGLCT